MKASSKHFCEKIILYFYNLCYISSNAQMRIISVSKYNSFKIWTDASIATDGENTITIKKTAYTPKRNVYNCLFCGVCFAVIRREVKRDIFVIVLESFLPLPALSYRWLRLRSILRPPEEGLRESTPMPIDRFLKAVQNSQNSRLPWLPPLLSWIAKVR